MFDSTILSDIELIRGVTLSFDHPNWRLIVLPHWNDRTSVPVWIHEA